MQKIGKEVKIGLAVIGVLLTTFGYVLVKRLTRPSEANAATVADASRTSGRTSAGSGAFDRPTMLDGSALKGPTIVPVAAKSSGFGDDSSRRHAGDSSASDPAAGSSDSFMPARSIASSSDNHLANPTRDDQVAAAGYGAGNGSASSYGAGSTPPGYATQANSSGGYGAASAKTGSIQNAAATDGGSVGKAAIDNSQTPAFPPLYGAAAATPAADAGDHHHAHAADNAGQATAVDPFQIRASTNGGGAPAASDSPAQALPSRDGQGAFSSPTPRATSANLGDAGPAPRTFDSSGASAQPTELSVRGSDPSAYQAPVPPPDVPRNDPTPSYAPPASAPSRLANIAPVGNSYAIPRSADSAAPQQLAADTPARKAGQYIVQPNDNYWTISEKVYGSGAYFKAIFEYNRNRHPQADRLQVGEALDTPDASVLQSTYPDLCPKATRAASAGRVVPASARMVPGTRVYTVEEGDTLFEIARRELGKPSRWSEVYQLNRETLGGDFDYLRPGTELLLPADGNGSGAISTPVARDQSGTILR